MGVIQRPLLVVAQNLVGLFGCLEADFSSFAILFGDLVGVMGKRSLKHSLVLCGIGDGARSIAHLVIGLLDLDFACTLGNFQDLVKIDFFHDACLIGHTVGNGVKRRMTLIWRSKMCGAIRCNLTYCIGGAKKNFRASSDHARGKFLE